MEWFLDGWAESLHDGWTDITGRRPILVRLKAGRLRPGCPDEAAAEMDLFRTIAHEISGHAWHVLAWQPVPPSEDRDRDEDEAQAFAARAIAAYAEHQRQVAQLLAGHFR